MPKPPLLDNDLEEIMANCLNLDSPRSFFLYAGAGTGKTRALIKAMKRLQRTHGTALRQSGRRVAVITYTNAACDEIRSRIAFDPVFAVSTIHSFAWDLICPFHVDVSGWLRRNLTAEIEDLEEKQARNKVGTKAHSDRAAKIDSKRARLQNLASIREFTYNPNGENIGKNSLHHAEVIAMSAAFLEEKVLMRQVLIRKHPVLLIDESQDTQKALIDAVFFTQSHHPDKFCLGLFGDTMQRIYPDGKEGLEKAVPDTWARPALKTNHRCPNRIVDLLNNIRSEADGAEQEAKEGAADGVVRLFLVNQLENLDRSKTEARAMTLMAEAASDDDWLDRAFVKLLTLEHHMAASRGGFAGFFEPLYRIDRYKTGLRDGTLSGVAFLVQQVLPLVQALEAEDRFGLAQVLKTHSPLLSAAKLRESGSAMADLNAARESTSTLSSLWDGNVDPSLMEVLERIEQTGLLPVPEVITPLVKGMSTTVESRDSVAEAIDDPSDPAIEAWREALQAPFSELRAYVEYVSDRSRFGTHHGIKGLQFPRVMVIVDDEEARGFVFSYEKLLGAKNPTATDERNKREGKETSIDKTRRLLYVTCSRAEQSLAILAYTKEPKLVAGRVKELGWFRNGEIVEL